MTEFYKGQRISELLATIEEMEGRLKALTNREESDPFEQPFSLAQYGEVANGYTSLAIAKAKLTALQGEN